MSKNSFFGTLTDVKKAPEASNSYPSAYIDTVGYELRSKLKCGFLLESRTFCKGLESRRQNEKAKKFYVDDAAF